MPLDIPVRLRRPDEEHRLESECQTKRLHTAAFTHPDEPTSRFSPPRGRRGVGDGGRVAAQGRDHPVLLITHKVPRGETAYCRRSPPGPSGGAGAGAPDGGAAGTMLVDGDVSADGSARLNPPEGRPRGGGRDASARARRAVSRASRGFAAFLPMPGLKVRGGDTVGIAGSSPATGSRGVVEAPVARGPFRRAIFIPRTVLRADARRLTTPSKVLPPAEEPLKNAEVPRVAVAENIASAPFDKQNTQQLSLPRAWAGGCPPGTDAGKGAKVIRSGLPV